MTTKFPITSLHRLCTFARLFSVRNPICKYLEAKRRHLLPGEMEVPACTSCGSRGFRKTVKKASTSQLTCTRNAVIQRHDAKVEENGNLCMEHPIFR